jgi:two-component system cell cycle response regulator
VTEPVPPRLLLAGDPAVRPEGLAAFLVRAGYVVDETAGGPGPSPAAERPAAEAVVLCVGAPDAAVRRTVADFRGSAAWADARLVALAAAGGAEATADLVAAGAHDALAAPVHFGELRARLDGQLAIRRQLRDLSESLQSRGLLFDIFQEISAALRPQDVFQTLVRRVGSALDVAHCSFVVAAPGDAQGRVVAVYEDPSIRDLRVDLDRYPEIEEALRTERPVVVPNVREHPLFAAIRKQWEAQALEIDIRSAIALPVFVQGAPSGVFFLRTREGDPELTSRDVALADMIAQAAAKVLENEERRAALVRRQSGAIAQGAPDGIAGLEGLGERLTDEFERARRYRLRFCLALLEVDQPAEPEGRLGGGAGERVLGELGHLLQRELRAPDFVARSGDAGFALVLPETDARGARHFLQRFRTVLSRHVFADLAGAVPAVSAGVVSYPHPDVLRAVDLFPLAEAALVAAKTTAPDRIAVSPGSDR